MPIVWSPENEARLLAGLFKVCDIKVSGAQLKELAAIIGPDCTAKAVTHRIAKFRKMTGTFNDGKKGGEAATEEPESENGVDATPKSKKGGKKRTATEDDDGGGKEQAVKKMKAEDLDTHQ